MRAGVETLLEPTDYSQSPETKLWKAVLQTYYTDIDLHWQTAKECGFPPTNPAYYSIELSQAIRHMRDPYTEYICEYLLDIPYKRVINFLEDMLQNGPPKKD